MNIALVELSESHEECIYSQVSFLKKRGHTISLFVHPKIYNTILYKEELKELKSVNFNKTRGFISLIEQFKLARNLSKFDKIIFNTASSSKKLRNIVLFLVFFKVECIGLLHNTKKLQKSFTQKLISIKIKKYFVLSEQLKNKAIVKNKKIRLEYFYPIFFPSIETVAIKKENIWICIPGRVTNLRRNYNFLIEKLSNNYNFKQNIKFIILGNINTPDGIQFKNNIKKLGLSNFFIFFDGFISNKLYYSYLKKSDYILPLLKKEDSSYLTNKITGTFNLAYGFKKKLLCNIFYKSIDDLKENASFYRDDNFLEVIDRGDSNDITNSYVSEKWTYEFQYNNYIKFVEL